MKTQKEETIKELIIGLVTKELKESLGVLKYGNGLNRLIRFIKFY